MRVGRALGVTRKVKHRARLRVNSPLLGQITVISRETLFVYFIWGGGVSYNNRPLMEFRVRKVNNFSIKDTL